MFLIDKNGERKRPTCWPCGKIHAQADCPKRRRTADQARTARIVAAIREAKRAVGQ
jgi:hypothetical protein